MAGSGRESAKESAAMLIAMGSTVRAAAQEADVSERTLYRWLADSDFKARVHELRGQIIDATLGKLVDATTSAATTLVALLSSGKELVRLRAACAILDACRTMREHVELAERITNLEERQHHDTGKPSAKTGSHNRKRIA